MLLPLTSSSPDPSACRQRSRDPSRPCNDNVEIGLLQLSLPLATITPLQRVQNAAARLIFELGTREHVTASLFQLHWLPVRWRVQLKLCCLMHSAFYGKCPDYLANVVSPVDCGRPRRGLRYSLSSDFAVTHQASVLSRMPARLRGTHYRRTYVLSLILDVVENDSRHTFLV